MTLVCGSPAQFSKAAKFYENVKRLIDAGAVGWSVGSMPGGYVEEPGGPKGVKRVASFLLAEMTLTPMPSQTRLAQGMLERSITDFSPVLGCLNFNAQSSNGNVELALEHIAHFRVTELRNTGGHDGGDFWGVVRGSAGRLHQGQGRPRQGHGRRRG